MHATLRFRHTLHGTRDRFRPQLLLSCAQNYTMANAAIKEKFNAQTEQFKLASALGERRDLMKELALARLRLKG